MRRLMAVLALRGLSVRALAALCGTSNSHFRLVMTGERQPSERLRDRIANALTPKEWRFVRGEIASLTPVSADKEEAPR